MYKNTVTVFNRQRTRDGDIWYPTILADVNLNVDRGAIVRQYGEQAQDNAVLNVRFDGNISDPSAIHAEISKSDGTTVNWLPPKEWQRLNNKTGYLTFAPGDFFWAGIWDGASAISDENYGDLSFYEYMTQNYDFVFNITSVGHFTVIPHFEVLGR